MTIVSTAASAGPFYGNGLTTAWPFTFQAAGADQVGAQVNGVMLDPAAYTVTLEDDGTGSVVIAPALASGAELFLLSLPDFAQRADFQRFGPVFPDELNPHLNLGAARDIYLREQIERAPRTPFGAAALAAGKFPQVYKHFC